MRFSIYLPVIFFTVMLNLQPADGSAQHIANEKIHFTRLTTLNGLSQSTVNSIVKDRAGFMWFGTNDGLNRYDGYSFKVYRNIPGDLKSLPYNLIRTLFVDSRGSLWVGTLGGGLARYDEKSDSFQRYPIGLIQRILEDSQGRIWVGTFDGLFVINSLGKPIRAEQLDHKYKILRGKIITALFQDQQKNMWIGTKNGLYLMYNQSAGSTVFFVSDQKKHAPESEIGDIAIDQKGILWVGTKGGLYQYNKDDSNFSPAQYLNNGQKKPVTGAINALSCDTDNTIWVATEEGLGRYHSTLKQYTVMTNDAFDTQSISRNSVNTLYSDEQMLWVGTALGGLNKYERNNSLISHYKIYNPRNQKANTNVITAFAEQNNGEIFIGTDGGGLFTWNAATNIFKNFEFSKNGNNTLGKSVLCLRKSRNGEKLWIGTYNDGLFELNISSNTVTRFHTGNNVLNNNAVYSILEDKQSNIWIGTNGGGVTVVNPKGHAIFQLNQNRPGTLTNNFIRALMEDQKGRIWIGTYGGINIFDPAEAKFVNPDPQIKELRQHLVCALFSDAYNKIWVGTQGAGLFIYNTQQKKLIHLTENQGLSNDNISSIVANHGFVWISTSRGLNRLPEKKPAANHFIYGKDLKDSEFTNGAGFSSVNGDLLFGSVDGFNLLHPSGSGKNALIPPVRITDFQIAGNSRSSNPKQIPKVRINEGKVELDYFQSTFTIEFASLNYLSNTKNTYAYRLDGLEKDWQYPGEDHKVTYHNLGPGKYVFKVKAANKDGVWNDQVTELEITILPPLWRTSWAYLLYSVVAFAALFTLLRELKARDRLKKELILEKLNAEKNRELNLLKMNFFTKVSHELRTPLSLIIDPLRKITHHETSHSQARSLSGLAFRHASRLLTLVNQLLDFRKLQESSSLERQSIDIRTFIREIVLGFKDRAIMRNLELNVKFVLDFEVVNIDADKFQKIITNLIANAFKFTPDGGRITLNTNTFTDKNQNRQLEMIISDTGPGIPEIYKNKIFEMFFQVNQTPQFETASSGIGLALVKELIELHEGEIYENGSAGEGARFILKVPAGKPALSKPAPVTEQTEGYIPTSSMETAENNFQQNETYNILVIDDNEAIRSYIASQLSTLYRIEVASSGNEGYQNAIVNIPDLIVSDVMMHNGDGFELCKKIKTNEKTSHIPVILLTARDADESKMEGYKSGADAYISKPFNSDLLLVRIAQLLESRQKLRALYQTENMEELANNQLISAIDEEFLRKAREVILKNLTQPGFDVPEFASLLDMNRRQLSRKLKAITDQTPQEYIIRIRLDTAVQLMLHQDLNISQAGYEVGFAEPANFSRSFARVYGQSPKIYMSEKYGKRAF